MSALSTELLNDLAGALKNNQTLPDLKVALSLDEAYLLQHQVTKRRSPGGVIGIKAGVTAEPVQRFFGLDQALIASLYDGTRLSSGAEISGLEGRVIESELALKTDEEGNPVEIAPALEIAAVRFAAKDQMNAANLVLCNLGADLFIVGDFVPWQPEYNDLTMKLVRGDEILNETSMSVALGGPGPGAKWVHQEAIAKGFSLSEDLIFMMGACGTVVPAETGHYVGDYGPLGTVELVVS